MPDQVFTFDKSVGLFVGANGERVEPSIVRSVMRQSLDEIVSRKALPLSVALQAGTISLPDWQIGMEKIVKSSYTMVGAIGAGGWKQADTQTWGKVGSLLRQEYTFLRRFGLQIEQGLALDGDFLRRVRMYVRGASASFEAAFRIVQILSGRYDAEARVLTIGAKHCTECILYSFLGWQTLGTLPDIGENCTCISNCECYFIYRESVV